MTPYLTDCIVASATLEWLAGLGMTLFKERLLATRHESPNTIGRKYLLI